MRILTIMTDNDRNDIASNHAFSKCVRVLTHVRSVVKRVSTIDQRQQCYCTRKLCCTPRRFEARHVASIAHGLASREV